MAFKKVVQIVGLSVIMALSVLFGKSLSADEYIDHLLTKKITASA